MLNNHPRRWRTNVKSAISSKYLPIDWLKEERIAELNLSRFHRNPFRELVLLHIKSTHMTIDKSNNAEAELDLLPCGEDQDGEPTETVTTATNSTLNAQSPLRTSLSPLSVVSPRSDSGNIGGLTGASTSASTTPSVTSGSAGGYNSNNFTTNATLIGVGLNFTQAVANDNRLGTTYTLSNTIPSVVFGGEVNRTINTASTTTKSTTISASSASASTTNTNTTTTPPSTSTTTTTTTTGGKGASNTWRPSAPYRCGHCHQVSNWKHVIQVFARSKFYYTICVLFLVRVRCDLFL